MILNGPEISTKTVDIFVDKMGASPVTGTNGNRSKGFA